MKVYPRIELDIAFEDLASALVPTIFGDERAKTTLQIQSFWDTPKAILVTLCVRTSFDLLLQALNLPAGSEIIMSAVNIGHMEEIVKKHNCIPVFVDLDLATLAPSVERFKSAISSRSRVFVIAHLFGSITPLDPYVELCRSQNILLVEDCAQAFDGLQYVGHADADISLFSFGPIKSCTALGGSVTLVQDQHLAKTMNAIEQRYPIKSDLWFCKRVLKYFLLKFLSAPRIFGAFVAFLGYLNIDLDHFISSLTRGFSQGEIQTQLRHRPPTGMLKLLKHRFEHLNLLRYAQREQLAKDFLAALDQPGSHPGKLAVRHSYWLVPLIAKNPHLLMQKMRAQGFDTTTGTTSLKALGDGSPSARKLMNSVLYLPIYPCLPTVELHRLARLMNLYSINPEVGVGESLHQSLIKI
jgi:perosamine synthetase